MTTKHTNVSEQWVRTSDVRFLKRIEHTYALTLQESLLIICHLAYRGRDSRKKIERSAWIRYQVGKVLAGVKVGRYSLILNTRFDLLSHLFDEVNR